MSKPTPRLWTEREEGFFRENWGLISDEAMACALDRTIPALKRRAWFWGVRKRENRARAGWKPQRHKSTAKSSRRGYIPACCTKCGLSIDDGAQFNGTNSYCRRCQVEYFREYRKRPGKLEKHANWMRTHRQAAKLAQRADGEAQQ